MSNTPSLNKNDFLPVRVTTLRAGYPLRFGAYIFHDEHYLEYRRPDAIFEEELLEKFRKKNIKKIYIREEDEPAYLAYLDEALNELSQADVPTEKKADFATETLASEAENVEKNLDTEEGYNASRNRLSKVIEFISTDQGGLKAMLSAAGVSVDNSQHSSSVASIAVGLAGLVGLTDKEELLAISLAALIHDNGLIKLGYDSGILIDDLPKDKRAGYRKHTEESVAMVAGKKYITPRVLRLVVDHHEVGFEEGLGYPEKKRIGKLSLSSQIFNLADCFDHHVMSTKTPAKDAFDSFYEKYERYFVPDHFALLEKVIKS